MRIALLLIGITLLLVSCTSVSPIQEPSTISPPVIRIYEKEISEAEVHVEFCRKIFDNLVHRVGISYAQQTKAREKLDAIDALYEEAQTIHLRSKLVYKLQKLVDLCKAFAYEYLPLLDESTYYG